VIHRQEIIERWSLKIQLYSETQLIFSILKRVVATFVFIDNGWLFNWGGKISWSKI